MKLFKIGDICELLAITPRTIRYYDQLGLLPNVKRSDGFTRLFDQNDIDLIKEIRKLQKSKAMPLTMIKDKLFPKNIKSKSVLLITDSISQKLLLLSSNLTVITIDSSKSQSHISQEIANFIKEKMTPESIIFCFFHESLTASYTTQFSSLKKDSFYLFPLKNFGMTNYLITEYATQNYREYSNFKEFSWVIKRFISLGFSLCLLDSLDQFLTERSDTEPSIDFLKKITSYKPLLHATQENYSVVSFYKNFNNHINEIAEIFDGLLQNQKRYIYKGVIFYSHSETLALKIQAAILEQCPNTSLTIEKLQDWSSSKFQVNFISVI